jgi:hypothetical protein
MRTNRMRNLRIAGTYFALAVDEGVCVYCGDMATEWDHVVPVSFAGWARDMGRECSGRLLAPSCRECNGIASNRVFGTIGEKREFIHGELKRRHDHTEWHSDEIAELGPMLAAYIRAGLRNKERLQQRLKWRNSEIIETARLADLNFPSDGIGLDFVPGSVLRKLIVSGCPSE